MRSADRDLTTANYLFFHRHKTRELVVPVLDLPGHPTSACRGRRRVSELEAAMPPAAGVDG